MNSHSRCRIGVNACGRSRRASRKYSANRSSTTAQRLASSRLISVRGVPAPEQSPLLATPRKASQPRPYASEHGARRPWKPARANPIACEMCGEPVLKRRRRHCDACMPKARREHGLRAIEAARKALAAQAAAGNDPRAQRRREPRARRGDQRGASPQSQLGARASRRSATRRGSSARSRRSSMRSTLAEIAKATGLSLAACSRIRGGSQIPHPRHWAALRELADS